jgi:uncharacterized protein YndB with AHSA1/START domain
MERKTEVHAQDGKRDVVITRVFDLPLDLLFKAYDEAELLEQWMGTKVVKLESKRHGSYEFETSNAQGKVVFRANGVIHEFVRDQRITRTFEMENMPFGVQLEFLEFENLSAETSKLTMHVIYESGAQRDDLMQKLPFVQGVNMAHNRLEEVVSKIR